MRLLKFSAEWCGPCKTAGPLVEALAKAAGAPLVSVDVDREAELTERYGVRSVPTMILVNDTGDPVYTGSGLGCLPELRVALSHYL